MTDGVSNEPVASIPTPISVEPRVAPPAEAAEVARQAEEAKLPRGKEAEPKAADKDEPVAKDKPRPSIREALAVAREKLDAKPISVAAKEAPAPSAAKTAEPAAVVKDTKEAPAAVAKDTKDAPVAAVARDEATGKFTKVATDTPAADAPKGDEPAKAPALPSHTASTPPARFSPAAKEKWAEAPEEVRAETERAVKELTQGFEKHRAAAERDAGLAEYHELAAKGGTDVKTALSKYVGMENLIRKDPVAGLHEIAKNAGLNLRDVAAKILNQPADEARSQADQRVAALENEIAELKKGFGTIHAERQQAQTDTTTKSVSEFAAANPRFEELADDIAFFLRTRTKDLAEAYKLAERLNPAPASPVPVAVASSAPVATAAATPPKPTLVSSSDAGSKSIAGTPTAGSDPVRKQPSNSIREAIRKAAAAAR